MEGPDTAISASIEDRDDELGDVLAVIVHLRQLRSQGLDGEEIARRVAVDHPRPPGGGTWSAATVEQVLRVADTSELHHQGHSDSSSAAGSDPGGRFDAPGSWVEPEPIRHRSRAEPTHPRVRGWPFMILGLFMLVTAAAIGYMLLPGGSSETVTANRADDELVSDGEDSIVADGAAGTTVGRSGGSPESEIGPPLVVELADPSDGENADTVSIRVGDGRAPGAGDLVPATATIRADGKLHVEGAFRSQDEADSFITQAAGIFGTEAIVSSYTVDPAAPESRVADVDLDKPVRFESGSARIDPEYIPFLEACAGVLAANPHVVMVVSAYTDSSGDEDFNLRLSQQRAQAIVDFYRDLRIASDQLSGSGFGEGNPVADNGSARGREQNRRATLTLANITDET